MTTESIPKRNRDHFALSLKELYPDRFDCDEDTAQEELEQYDFPGLNLGTESLAATPKSSTGFTFGAPSRSRLRSLEGRSSKQVARKAASVDRNCMICFETALRPSRTRCCGKLFCEAHINDWLAKSSNCCPWCSAYCHPDTGVISLASPASPTAHSTGTGTTIQHERGETSLKRSDSLTRSRSFSSSSSTSSQSCSSASTDPSLEQDDEQISDIESFGFSSFLSNLIRHFLDDPTFETPVGTRTKYPISSEDVSPLVPSPSLETQISHRSSGSTTVDVHELTALALVSKVIGKVLTLVALILVFWVLTR